jgi:2,4-didehydro-3-deoxy-L-rhamnonate hydrolase
LYLMRIGAPGAEKPIVRVNDTHYVDVSDIVADFNEEFFATGGPALLEQPVAERIAAGALSTFAASGSALRSPGRIRFSASA